MVPPEVASQKFASFWAAQENRRRRRGCECSDELAEVLRRLAKLELALWDLVHDKEAS